jgi:hypothetical protein
LVPQRQVEVISAGAGRKGVQNSSEVTDFLSTFTGASGDVAEF